MTDMRRVIAEGGTFSAEYRIVYKDGSIRHWIDRGSILCDANGEAIRWIGAISDITDRKQAEKSFLQERSIAAHGHEAGASPCF